MRTSGQLLLICLIGVSALNAVSNSAEWDKLDSVLSTAIQGGVFPGCVGLVGSQEVRFCI